MLCDHIADDYRRADIPDATRAALDFALKLTRTPGEMNRGDVQQLRAAGWDDVAIHDITQVAAYFNYINRIADGLEVDLEPGMPPRPDQLL